MVKEDDGPSPKRSQGFWTWESQKVPIKAQKRSFIPRKDKVPSQNEGQCQIPVVPATSLPGRGKAHEHGLPLAGNKQGGIVIANRIVTCGNYSEQGKRGMQAWQALERQGRRG